MQSAKSSISSESMDCSTYSCGCQSAHFSDNNCHHKTEQSLVSGADSQCCPHPAFLGSALDSTHPGSSSTNSDLKKQNIQYLICSIYSSLFLNQSLISKSQIEIEKPDTWLICSNLIRLNIVISSLFNYIAKPNLLWLTCSFKIKMLHCHVKMYQFEDILIVCY